MYQSVLSLPVQVAKTLTDYIGAVVIETQGFICSELVVGEKEIRNPLR